MFSFRLRAAVVLFTIGTLVGCTEDKITAASSHPWKGDCILDGTLTNVTTLIVTGTCQLNGLGAATYASTQLLNNDASTFTATTTITFSNGAQMRTTNVGASTGTATGLAISGTDTVVGGTGQFGSATGAAAFVGVVTFTSATTTRATITYDGTVTY